MRVSIDLDTLDKKKLHWVSRKGKKLIGRRPDRIYRTGKGYHIIWYAVKKYGRDITEEEMMELRRKLGDDTNRIRLDSHTGRIKQVLFSSKKVSFFNENKELIKIKSSKRIRIR